jgi:hypothetical protein
MVNHHVVSRVADRDGTASERRVTVRAGSVERPGVVNRQIADLERERKPESARRSRTGSVGTPRHCGANPVNRITPWRVRPDEGTQVVAGVHRRR